MITKIDDFLAVIVLYETKIEESATVQTLFKCLKKSDSNLKLLFYDNSPLPQNPSKIPKIDALYIHNYKNPGVGQAYNEANRLAIELKKEWLLLLDQDTIVPENFFSISFKAMQSNPAIKLFAPIIKLSDNAIFSPLINKHKRGYRLKEPIFGIHMLKKYSAVNSGMIVNVRDFDQSGGFNPEIKMDFADFQFLKRFEKISHYFFVTDAICIQNFSGSESSLPKQITRFQIYLKDALLAEKDNFKDRIEFFYTVTRHALGLCIKFKSLSFIKIYLKQYILKAIGRTGLSK